MMALFLRHSRLGWLAVFLGAWLTATLALADTAPPPGLANVPLNQRVIDLTQTLDAATRERLSQQLAALEQRKGAQVAVMLVSSTDGQSIEDYANTLFRAWQLGRKDINDGVLLLVAKDDRKMRIEVGYGLEGVVTDLLADRIIREHMTPAFRQGDFAGGIELAVNALVLLVEGGQLPEVAPEPLPKTLYAVILAIVLGAIAGPLLAAGKFSWRWALFAVLAMTAGSVLLVGGKDWPALLLLVPVCMLVGGATFAGLWQAPKLFFAVLGLLAYIGVLTLINHFVGGVSFIYGLVLPLAGLMLIGGYWLLYRIMRNTYENDRASFFIRLWILLAVYLVLGFLSMLRNGAMAWVVVLPFCSIVAFFIFLCLLYTSPSPRDQRGSRMPSSA